jgi:hypothetical protein
LPPSPSLWSRSSARIARRASRRWSPTKRSSRSSRCCWTFTSILGFVLQGDPSLQDDIVRLGAGTFALVIGLLSWFWLGSHILLGAAETNVVLHRRLWPRSLTGELEPADRLAMRGSAAAARQDPRELISVTFNDDGK